MSVAIAPRLPNADQLARAARSADPKELSSSASESRRAVGLPDHVEDAIVLARVVAVLATATRQMSVESRGVASPVISTPPVTPANRSPFARNRIAGAQAPQD